MNSAPENYNSKFLTTSQSKWSCPLALRKPHIPESNVQWPWHESPDSKYKSSTAIYPRYLLAWSVSSMGMASRMIWNIKRPNMLYFKIPNCLKLNLYKKLNYKANTIMGGTQDQVFSKKNRQIIFCLYWLLRRVDQSHVSNIEKV